LQIQQPLIRFVFSSENHIYPRKTTINNRTNHSLIFIHFSTVYKST
jgi:hypothetical protein